MNKYARLLTLIVGVGFCIGSHAEMITYALLSKGVMTCSINDSSVEPGGNNGFPLKYDTVTKTMYDCGDDAPGAWCALDLSQGNNPRIDNDEDGFKQSGQVHFVFSGNTLTMSAEMRLEQEGKVLSDCTLVGYRYAKV